MNPSKTNDRIHLPPGERITIIGAGGVGGYLLPALVKTVQNFDQIEIIDGDAVEERNLERQFGFTSQDVGMSKAELLARRFGTKFQSAYISDRWKPDFIGGLIFSCVDNHPARKNILAAADATHSNAIIAGNEYISAQTLFYRPVWKGKKLDPRVRYPEILTVTDDDPLHPSCTEGVENFPQLAIFNNLAASLALQLMWIHYVEARQITMQGVLPVEYSATIGRYKTITVGELL